MDNIDRNKKIVSAFLSGIPGTKIGKRFKMSRERVRQILNNSNISKYQGGFYLSNKIKYEQKKLNYENKWKPWWGCTNRYYYSISRDIRDKFRNHKSSANFRGIVFSMSFPEWVKIWEDSGKFNSRGVNGYVMARLGDTGGYSVGNVKIISSSENHKEAWVYKKWIPSKNRVIKLICPNGHKKEGVTKNGGVYCRVCARESYRKYYEKKKSIEI